MKMAIVGIGGVGGYYGGLLAKRYSSHDDVEIVFIAHGDHLKPKKKIGVKDFNHRSKGAHYPP
jgi:2-dehydropantoate 2-reductase